MELELYSFNASVQTTPDYISKIYYFAITLNQRASELSESSDSLLLRPIIEGDKHIELRLPITTYRFESPNFVTVQPCILILLLNPLANNTPDQGEFPWSDQHILF